MTCDCGYCGGKDLYYAPGVLWSDVMSHDAPAIGLIPTSCWINSWGVGADVMRRWREKGSR